MTDSRVNQDAVASLMTVHGPLLIYTTDALVGLVSSMPTQPIKDMIERTDKLDGYSLPEWAAFARKKAKIASSVAKLNGELRAKLGSVNSTDAVFPNDPPDKFTRMHQSKSVGKAVSYCQGNCRQGDAERITQMKTGGDHTNESPTRGVKEQADSSCGLVCAATSVQEEEAETKEKFDDECDIAETFEEFLCKYEEQMMRNSRTTCFPNKSARAVRDVWRPLESYGWKSWASKFYCGSGDPAWRSEDELNVYLQAIQDWHHILHQRDRIDKEKLVRVCCQLSGARNKLNVIAAGGSKY